MNFSNRILYMRYRVHCLFAKNVVQKVRVTAFCKDAAIKAAAVSLGTAEFVVIQVDELEIVPGPTTE